MFLLSRFAVWFNLFVLLFLVTACNAVVIQPCIECISNKRKKEIFIKIRTLSLRLLLWEEMSPNLFVFLSKKKPWDGFESLTLKAEFFDDIKTECFK